MFLKFISTLLIKYLELPSSSSISIPTSPFKSLKETIEIGDVLLVEGRQKFSSAIKYLTQSNWSHAALYVGNDTLIEADLKLGVLKININKYEGYHTRICRPVKLNANDLNLVIKYIQEREGLTYDIKNIFDLAKYLFPVPIVPNKWKRKVLELGSHDTTKVICSSVIAQAFQSVGYPILPLERCIEGKKKLAIRHHSLFTPSDFDRSPYFQIIKPTIQKGFDYKQIDLTSN
ncbi:MAG: lipo-like protein [Bdellovibrionales bacterium]|jgi:hypothetical protein|nr:lipo-like protein [Bdellovibrionales bacterium]